MIEPRANPALFGHEAAEAAFAAALGARRPHHAWLITGPEGVGKATLAFRLLRRLLGGRDDPADPVFRRVAQRTHADLLTVERAFDDKRKRLRSEIVVDDARAVAGFLRLTPAEGGWRAVVVDGAEHLNRNAANALLKVLEEPPPRAMLLLTCAAPGRLLATIRSRCRTLGLRPLDEAAMARALEAVLPAADAGVIGLAGGSPGRAVLLAEQGGMAIASLVDEALEARLPTGRAWQVAEAAGRSEESFGTFMTLLRDRLAASVRAEARTGEPAARGLAASGEVWHALGRLQDETERSNLDRRHAIVAGLDLLNAR